MASVGRYHTMITTKDGAAKATGRARYGQLGTGRITDEIFLTNVSMPDYVFATAVSAGYRHSLLLSTSGAVYATGHNQCGELGLGDAKQRNSFQQVKTLSNVKTISAGVRHSAFLKADGTVWTAGRNHHGQLGMGDNKDRSYPTQVTALKKKTIIDVKACYYYTLFLTVDGSVLGAGQNNFGQLGLGHNVMQSLVPTPVLDADYPGAR
eukprot:gnl/TRDRNA2_/TRDRNA2_172803_c2_seq7.p1 gnl/TRDRNA2_/TRDRNA2_172803_c2~~gnl/TRDRNA2_/TRDRNA2_172803_c2_seq7.p1  ORF type:complete len:220 (-),score=29.73 gnl/TRDRNA2_/TRDRNA2_172803_c2_seq7:3-626(-)